jgi:5-methylthioribose kinase
MMRDIEQSDELVRYLQERGSLAKDEWPRVTVLTGGVSNRTVLVERETGEAWVLKQALEKLRVIADWFAAPERIHREAEGLRWLCRVAPLNITPLVFEDRVNHLLAMKAVSQPHENWKTMLLSGRLQHRHVAKYAVLLATIHRQGDTSAFARAFADRSFFESLRLEPYYRYTASRVPNAAAFLDQLCEATLARQLTLVHGDYSPKNILVYQDKLVLLDHEVIHFGDPAFDLGFALTHLLSKAHHVRHHRAGFATGALKFWETYTNTLGVGRWQDDLETFAVRHTLACLLARVAGRSPLEYLTVAEREVQQRGAVAMMMELPNSIPELVTTFLTHLEVR